jgi:hypothetical protein
MVAIAFSQALSPLPLDVIISEKHTSELEITEIPIENGARITDHAFVLPKKITLDSASANAAAVYNALVAIQESRVPFTFVSGLFVYTNMLIKSLSAERDKTFSQVLRCTADLQEIIIVSTAYAADPTGDSSGDPTNTSSSKLNSTNAGDTATADRVTGTTLRGDTGVTTSNTSTGDDSSLLHQITQ